MPEKTATFVVNGAAQGNLFAPPWWCDENAHRGPQAYLCACPKYRETPLHEMRCLADSLGLARVAVKDETSRLGLGSFKALGGAYAVFRFAQRRAAQALDRAVTVQEMQSDAVRAALEGTRVCCASDGNHGRSVAAGARLLGLGCVVFLHQGVPEERASVIRDLGASIVRVAGSYEDSVNQAVISSRAEGWALVADTTEESGEAADLCGFTMQGYTIMVQEVLEQQRSSHPFTHVFVQAGVGGLAAAVMGHWTAVAPDDPPRFIVVEPDRSASLLESAKSGGIVRIPDGKATVMAMLECQKPSRIAWPVVSSLASGFMTVCDDDARQAKSHLRQPIGSDFAIEAGESGSAGFAALLRAARDEELWIRLGLNENSSVLVLVTEAG